MASENENEKRETIADIVAEMKRTKYGDEDCSVKWCLREWADRIEEAWKREARAIATEHAVLPAVCITERSGNAAAMREALENSNGLLEELAAIGECGESAREQIAENNAALAAPARNCDNHDTKHEAKRAWFLDEVQPRLDGKRMDHDEIPFFDWLFEKARKGGAK